MVTYGVVVHGVVGDLRDLIAADDGETPGRLATALITERGVYTASEAGLLSLYPEQAKAA